MEEGRAGLWRYARNTESERQLRRGIAGDQMRCPEV